MGPVPSGNLGQGRTDDRGTCDFCNYVVLPNLTPR